jgi:hypothetical protein
MGDRRDAYRVLARRHEGRRPLVRPRIRWEDNIKMDFQEWDGGMDWTDLAQDRYRCRANVVINLWVP